MRSTQRIRIALWFIALTPLCGLLGDVTPAQSPNASVKSVVPLADLERLFRTPPDDSRIMMRWWWFGPAVTEAELEREMRLMKEGGIGGFEVQPVYPVVLDDPASGIKTRPFLSDDFIEVLRFTSRKARELGLRFDLTLGSGWPYGGPTVSVGEAAGRLRVERVNVPEDSRHVRVPSIGAGEKLLAVFAARAEGNSIATDSLREITDIRNGAVWVPDDLAGPIQVQFFIASRTGMQVKRPAVGSEGFVLDHLDRASIDSYLKQVGDPLMRAFDTGPPHAVFCDSLEVYNSDWTGDFLEEFQRRRGYDLKPHLPALVNDLSSKSTAIRHDWGQTLTELLNDRFLKPLHEWSRRNKTQLRIQCYGVPAAALSSNAYADLSEGEGHRWKGLSSTRWASSANHLLGRPVTSSETWTWLHSPSFRATPLDVKAEADLHFLQGVNQLIGHGWPYTAPGVEYPGWRFYAAGVFNEKNPWWIVMPDVSKYLQRLSFLLRQGEPRNDVAIYLPNDDAWSRFTNGSPNLIDLLRQRLGANLIPAVLESGYNFDCFDDEMLKRMGRVENGSLVLGPNKYKAVILPNVEQIPIETLVKLGEFAQTGGSLIATQRRPTSSPGYQAKPSDHQLIAEASTRLFEGPNARGRLVTDETGQLGTVLNAALRPDISLSPAAPDIGFIHRATGDGEIYFIANTGNEPRRTKATFRIAGLNPEWWDPMSGEVRPATVEGRDANGVSISLDLEPYGSRVLVFSRRGPVPLASVSDHAPVPIDLSDGWQVSFGEGASITMDTLRSWTDDEKTRFYSGLAVYEKSFQFPEGFSKKGRRVRLELGDGRPVAAPPNPRANGMRALMEGPVREAAAVTVNGRRAGSVWCPPYSIDVTDFLKIGENKLRIVVGNTAINHMAGRALPDYRLLNLRYGERFQPQDMDKLQPVPSGLLGRIRLASRPVE
ncbi:MAG TPA: glycosyl hydrolase [Blastocatellia bacterium]|nr:glycosyl hydrolase [Blastocatellia bacterium]